MRNKLLAMAMAALLLTPILFAQQQPEAVKEEVPAQSAETKVTGPKRIKVGLNLEYQYMTAEGFSGLYGRAIGGGLEVSYLLGGKIDLFLGASYSGRSKDLDWMAGTSKYTMLPFSAGIKYYLVQKEKLAVFVGGGLLYILYKDTTPYTEVNENIFGGSILGGVNYKLSDRFFAQARLQYNLAKKTLDVTPTADFPLDLSNVELKIGLFYAF